MGGCFRDSLSLLALPSSYRALSERSPCSRFGSFLSLPALPFGLGFIRFTSASVLTAIKKHRRVCYRLQILCAAMGSDWNAVGGMPRVTAVFGHRDPVEVLRQGMQLPQHFPAPHRDAMSGGSHGGFERG